MPETTRVAVRVLVDIGGDHVPLAACEWVWYTACGCPFACATAYTPDEDLAWREMFGTKRESDKQRRRGVTAELMTFKRWRAEIADRMRTTYTCPHRLEDPDA